MDLEPIPGPRGLPFLGNLLDLKDEEAPLRAFHRLADMYGPIYRLNIKGRSLVVVSTADLMKEIMNEKKFLKNGIPVLQDPDRPDGLIVASTVDPDWEQAHRILRPAFGAIKIEDMFDDMKDIAYDLQLGSYLTESLTNIEITDTSL